MNSYEDFSIEVSNVGDEEEQIKVEVDGDYEGLIEPVEGAKIIGVGESKIVKLKISNVEFLRSLPLNKSSGDILVTTKNNYKKEVPISISITDNEEGGGMWIWIIAVSVLILFIIGGFLVYRRYRILSQESQQNNNQSSDDEIEIDGDFDV